jgi:hypothetical protein
MMPGTKSARKAVNGYIPLRVHWTNTEVALERFDGLFRFGALDRPGPAWHGVVAGQIGAQYLAALAPADLA